MRMLSAAATLLVLWFSPAVAQPIDQGLVVAGQDAVPQVALPGDSLIQGVRMKSEPINPYEGTPFWEAGRPVGYLEVVARGSITDGPRTIPCTAWLVGPDVIITAWHCLPGLPQAAREAGWTYASASVTFGFDEIGSPGVRYTVGRILEANQELDYALARLLRPNPSDPPPGDTFGVIRVSRQYRPGGGAPVFMVHHPYGYSKLLLKDPTCRVFDHPAGGAEFLYHRCDTRGGSSGAPILMYSEAESEVPGARSFIAVGLHSHGTVGGLVNDNDSNIAVSVASIIEVSPYLQAVECDDDYQRPYCRNISNLAPVPLLVFFDFDRTDLTVEGRAAVISLAERIAADPTINRVSVVGHSDPHDHAASYAVGIANRRARTVADALVALGVNGSMITVEGRGEVQPLINTGTTNRLNRRVEISYERLPEIQQ